MEYKEIPIDKISLGDLNKRQDLGDLSSLIWSIKRRHLEGKRGVIDPIIVRKLEEDPSFEYELIDGKRRISASTKAGLSTIPAFIETEESDISRLKWMSREANKFRLEYTWMEDALFYMDLVKEGLTQEDIAERDGVVQSVVSQKINALKLTEQHYRQAIKLDYTIIRTIKEKCPVKEIPSALELAVSEEWTKKIAKNVLFRLRNFLAQLSVLKEFNKELYDELKGVYFSYRFKPKVIKLFEKERDLRTGEAPLRDNILDEKEFPTEQSARDYASRYHGEFVGNVSVSGWHVRVIPYTIEEVREELEKLVK